MLRKILHHKIPTSFKLRAIPPTVLFLSFLFSTFGLLSVNPAKAAKNAKVSIDGAMIYKGPSFDAPVIAYLKKGKKVRISSRTYGPFYKVRLRKGLYGYISDIDVKVHSAGSSKKRRKRGKKGKSRGKLGDDERESEDSGPQKPIFATKFAGLQTSFLGFKEEILEQKVSSTILNYGFRVSGPNLVIPGPFMFDITVLLGFSPPGYYVDLTDPQTSASGLMATLDVNMLFPVISNRRGSYMVYIGAGPMVQYTKFDLVINDEPLSFSDVKLGASFGLGYGLRIWKLLLKTDMKFYVEKNSYFGFGLGLQYGF